MQRIVLSFEPTRQGQRQRHGVDGDLAVVRVGDVRHPLAALGGNGDVDDIDPGFAPIRLAFGARRPDDQIFGLLGFGRIGRRIAGMARAIGYTVQALDPMLTDDDAARAGVVTVTQDELIATSDILSLHVPLLSSTANIIGAAELARVPQGAILINVSRGGLIDEGALIRARESGHIAGAGLDAFVGDDAPLGNNPLRGLPQIRCCSPRTPRTSVPSHTWRRR